jgi:hypothetical protein
MERHVGVQTRTLGATSGYPRRPTQKVFENELRKGLKNDKGGMGMPADPLRDVF